MPTDFSHEQYLQIFTCEDDESGGDYYEYFSIGIHNIPFDIPPNTIYQDGLWDVSKLNEIWDNLANSVPGKKRRQTSISFQNIPMAKISGMEVSEDLITNLVTLFALHKDKIIKFECGYGIYGGNLETATKNDLLNNQKCLTFFNSLNFID
jgi:hypothetical protein